MQRRAGEGIDRANQPVLHLEELDREAEHVLRVLGRRHEDGETQHDATFDIRDVVALVLHVPEHSRLVHAVAAAPGEVRRVAGHGAGFQRAGNRGPRAPRWS